MLFLILNWLLLQTFVLICNLFGYKVVDDFLLLEVSCLGKSRVIWVFSETWRALRRLIANTRLCNWSDSAIYCLLFRLWLFKFELVTQLLQKFQCCYTLPSEQFFFSLDYPLQLFQFFYFFTSCQLRHSNFIIKLLILCQFTILLIRSICWRSSTLMWWWNAIYVWPTQITHFSCLFLSQIIYSMKMLWIESVIV